MSAKETRLEKLTCLVPVVAAALKDAEDTRDTMLAGLNTAHNYLPEIWNQSFRCTVDDTGAEEELSLLNDQVRKCEEAVQDVDQAIAQTELNNIVRSCKRKREDIEKIVGDATDVIEESDEEGDEECDDHDDEESDDHEDED